MDIVAIIDTKAAVFSKHRRDGFRARSTVRHEEFLITASLANEAHIPGLDISDLSGFDVLDAVVGRQGPASLEEGDIAFLPFLGIEPVRVGGRFRWWRRGRTTGKHGELTLKSVEPIREEGLAFDLRFQLGRSFGRRGTVVEAAERAEVQIADGDDEQGRPMPPAR